MFNFVHLIVSQTQWITSSFSNIKKGESKHTLGSVALGRLVSNLFFFVSLFPYVRQLNFKPHLKLSQPHLWNTTQNLAITGSVPGLLPVSVVHHLWSEENPCTAKRKNSSVPIPVGSSSPHTSQSFCELKRSLEFVFWFFFFGVFFIFLSGLLSIRNSALAEAPINFA